MIVVSDTSVITALNASFRISATLEFRVLRDAGEA